MLQESSFGRAGGVGWLTVTICMMTMLLGVNVLASGGDVVNPGLSDHGDPILDPAEPSLPYVPNQLVIEVAPGVDAFDLIEGTFGGVIHDSLKHASIYLIEMESGFDAEAFAAIYDSMWGVAWAHPNYILNRLHPVQGSYPFSDEQYVGSYSEQYSSILLDLANSHNLATGAGVTVGVIDGGIDASYDIFDGVLQSGYDFVDGDGEPSDEPGGQASGHGTFVAGVLHLMAPDAQIRPYRVFDQSGAGDGFSLALAIEQAVDDGCHVLNLSLVLAQQHLAVQEAINFAESMDVVVVAAAGNESTDDPVFPASYGNVIAVAALDSAMLLTSFSNYGTHIDVCAPGFGVYSAYLDGFYAWWSGSSFAAPFVAGQAALLKEASPAADGNLIRLAIVESAFDIDAINPNVSGLLGGGLANPTGSIEEIANTETAWLTPDTVFFDVHEGTHYFTPPFEMTYVYSSIDPASYVTEAVDDGTAFSWLQTQSNMTPDTVIVQLETFALPVGTHYDTYLFHVNGVLRPAELTVCAEVLPVDTTVTAWATPDHLIFEADSTQVTAITRFVYLESSNAPADFTAQVIRGDDGLLSVIADSWGTTNDSARIRAYPQWMPGPGVYVDTVVYTIQGVAEQVVVPVYLSITDTMPHYNCSVTPMFQALYSDEGVDSLQYGSVFIISTNAPANYSVSVVGVADFISLPNPTGQTDDSLIFEVFNDSLMPAGLYTDTLEINVDGCDNSPRLAVVYLQVGDVGPTGDTCWVYPGFQALYAPEGVDYAQFGSIFIGSSNAPQAITISVVDFPDFIGLPFSIIYTNDSLVFSAFSDSTMPAGIYADTLRFDVDSVDNSPKYAVVYLQVGDVGPTGDTCWIYPGSQAFHAPGGVDYLQYGSVFIGSNNSPQAYSVRVLDYPNFTVLPTTEGVTSDSLVFEVVSRNFTNPGIYTDTLEITVDSVDNSPRIAVLYLQIYEPNSDSLWLIPDTLQIVVPEGSTTPFPAYSMLWSSYGPTTYTAFIDTTQSWLSLIDSAGLTQDSVGVIVNPSGLAAGFYSEIVWYLAAGISDDALLHVHLTVIDSSAGDSLILTPDLVEFSVTDGSTTPVTVSSWLSSSASPMSFTGFLDTVSSLWMTLADTAGVTDDSVSVIVDPTGFTTGTYYGQAFFQSPDANNTASLLIKMVVDSFYQGADSAWVQPNPLIFSAPFGSTVIMIDTAILFSTNLPAAWTGYVLGFPTSFMTLQDSAGLTHDSIIVWADPSGLAPGWYGDTVIMYVAGISQPVLLTVMLNVYTTDSVSALQNFPNPFNPSTQISFGLGAPSRVNLTVYNITGQIITVIVDQHLEAGKHSFQFDGSRVSSGVYFYRLQTETAIETRKMILLK